MANQATSRSDDLMVGAGALYFQRSDDPHGLHHLGNVEEFNITTDITTVEKNSAMNKARELMASVTTAVNPTGTMTMNEYNPYNLALGLYGREGAYSQTAQTLTNAVFTAVSVPGVIELKDADGNRLYDVQNLTVTNPTPSTSTFTATAATSTTTIGTTTVANDTLTDTAGGGTVVASGTSTGLAMSIYVQLDTANTAPGDLAGMVVDILEGGSPISITMPSGTNTYTWNSTLRPGLALTFTVGASDSFTTNSAFAKFDYVPSTTTLTNGIDYIADEQMLRAGLIQIPAGSSLTSGDSILVNATVPGKDFVTVSGADAGEIQGQLLFVGDPNIGGQYVIEGWKVKLRPEGDLTGLIGEDFGSFQLTVQFLADKLNHPHYPYYKATHIGRNDGSNINSGVYDPEY